MYLGVIAFAGLAQQVYGLHTVVRTGDVELLLGILLIALPVFTWATIRHCQFERLGERRLQGHLRQCAVHYPIVAYAAWWLPMHYAELGLGLRYGLIGLFFAIALVAILVNGFVLHRISRGAPEHE